jgi:hypothetical protein
VILPDEVAVRLRRCCTVAELQLMLCGAGAIDVDDWRAATRYKGGFAAGSAQVRAVLRAAATTAAPRGADRPMR